MPTLTLPYPPSCNRYWRNYRGRAVMSAEARQYKFQVGLLGRQISPVLSDVALSLVLHPVAPKRRTNRPVRCLDLDNALKVAIDSLQCVVYANDRQIVDLRIRRGEPVKDGALVVEWEEA